LGPNDVESNREQPKSESIGDELARLGRESKGAEDIERGPAEGEPADEERQTAVPEPGGIGG
jgi:hypothetical protein